MNKKIKEGGELDSLPLKLALHIGNQRMCHTKPWLIAHLQLAMFCVLAIKLEECVALP